MNDLALLTLRPLTVVVIVAVLLTWFFEFLGFPWEMSFKAGVLLGSLYLGQYLYFLNSNSDTTIQIFFSAWLFCFVYIWLSFNQ